MHIVEAIDEIQQYLQEIDYNGFAEHSMMRFACIKQLEIIGEASNHLSSETRAKNQQVAWSEIIALRNILVHEYFGIDSKIIWDILQTDMPMLRDQVETLIRKLPESKN